MSGGGVDWRARVRGAFGAQPPDDDVIEELAEHLEANAAAMTGLPPEERDRRLEDQLAGCVAAASRLVPARRARRVWPKAVAGRGVVAGLALDLRWAWRLARRGWRSSLVVLATIAIGIAACTTIASVAYAVLIKPLPWPEAERLIRVAETRQGSTRPAVFFTNGTYHAWREDATTIEGLAGYRQAPASLTDPGEAERISVAWVTPGLFPLLRARPLLGSLFRDDGHVDESAVVISHGLWQRRFGGRPDVVGRTVRLDGEPCVVAGVMPAGFAFPDPTVRAWLPLTVPPVANANGSSSVTLLRAVARLRPGATVAQAAEEATARGRAAPDPGMVGLAVFASSGALEVVATPLVDALLGDVRPALGVLLLAVVLLLATATANVAGLQLARAVARRRETAVRAAVGASGGQLVRQRLVESLLLGLAGAGVGFLLAGALHAALPALLPADFPRLAEIAFDWRAAAVASGLGVLSSVVFGIVPALQARRLELVGALTEEGQAPAGMTGRTWAARMRLVIVAAQVATACLLLVGGALLGRSFLALREVERGFEPRNLLTARLLMPDGLYEAPERVAALDRMLARLRVDPRVLSVAYASKLPLAGPEQMSAFSMRGPDGATVTISAMTRHVSSDYLETLGIRLLAGRTFDASDTADSAPVMLVNREFARQYLGERPLEAELPQGFSRLRERPARVIGVVDDVLFGRVGERPQAEMYQPIAQMGSGWRIEEPLLVVRSRHRPGDLVPVLRSVVADESRSLALDSVLTMEDRLEQQLARPRLYAILLAAFAVFAALLAAVGLFGTLSYAVAQRSREIGIRTALGATSGEVVRLVLRQALRATAFGLLLGLAAAAAGARFLGSLLFGVDRFDPLSFAAGAALVAALALLSCAVPARRAASVDPVSVLK